MWRWWPCCQTVLRLFSGVGVWVCLSSFRVSGWGGSEESSKANGRYVVENHMADRLFRSFMWRRFLTNSLLNVISKAAYIESRWKYWVSYFSFQSRTLISSTVFRRLRYCSRTDVVFLCVPNTWSSFSSSLHLLLLQSVVVVVATFMAAFRPSHRKSSVQRHDELQTHSV